MGKNDEGVAVATPLEQEGDGEDDDSGLMEIATKENPALVWRIK